MEAPGSELDHVMGRNKVLVREGEQPSRGGRIDNQQAGLRRKLCILGGSQS